MQVYTILFVLLQEKEETSVLSTGLTVREHGLGALGPETCDTVHLVMHSVIYARDTAELC